ncbi:MAG: hypothetical protein AABZ12_06000 [Planctomycetota bacterium]
MLGAESAAALEFPDEQQYWRMAGSLREGSGLRDEFGFRATRMPLYPAFLSLFPHDVRGVVLARIAQWLIGAGGAAAAMGLGLAMGGRRVGVFAGLAAAFDPFSVFFASLLLTETAYVAGLSALWWAIVPLFDRRIARVPPRRWITVAVAAIVCVYLRESTLGLILVGLGASVLVRAFDPRIAAGAISVTLLVLASLVPWAWRNKSTIGEYCWLTTRAGVSLYDGVGPRATGASDLGDVQQSPGVAGLRETEWNRHFLAESAKAIRNDPARLGNLALVKAIRMWNPIPNVEQYRSGLFRVVSAAWMLPIYSLVVCGAACGMRVRGGPEWLLVAMLLLPAAYFTLLHSLFVGSVRYRLPAMPMLEVLAAMAVVAAMERLRRRRPLSDATGGEIGSDRLR